MTTHPLFSGFFSSEDLEDLEASGRLELPGSPGSRAWTLAFEALELGRARRSGGVGGSLLRDLVAFCSKYGALTIVDRAGGADHSSVFSKSSEVQRSLKANLGLAFEGILKGSLELDGAVSSVSSCFHIYLILHPDWVFSKLPLR